MPDQGVVGGRIGEAFGLQEFRVHAQDQHLFVVRAVEDANAPAFGQIARAAPEKVVLQLERARVLEAEDLAALRVHARHHVADRAVLAGSVHRLEDQQ